MDINSKKFRGLKFPDFKKFPNPRDKNPKISKILDPWDKYPQILKNPQQPEVIPVIKI